MKMCLDKTADIYNNLSFEEKGTLEKLNIGIEETTTMDAQDLYLSKGFTLEELNNLKF